MSGGGVSTTILLTLTQHTRIDDGTLLCGYHHREHHKLGWKCPITNGIPHWTPPPWTDPTQTPRRNHAHQPESGVPESDRSPVPP